MKTIKIAINLLKFWIVSRALIIVGDTICCNKSEPGCKGKACKCWLKDDCAYALVGDELERMANDLHNEIKETYKVK